MKSHYTILVFLIFIACSQSKPTETKFAEKHTTIIDGDTIYKYYKNGSVKEKGVYKESLKNGWWFYYDTLGVLKKKIDYKGFAKDTIYKNQIIYFDKGLINKDLSTYFLLEIPDTISLGRNLAKVKLYNSNFKADHNLITVIVNNQYSKNKFMKDTFSDGTLKPLFGVYGYKTGKQKINGIIEETIIFDEVKNKDTTLVIQKHLKYFEKEIYVKDNNTE